MTHRITRRKALAVGAVSTGIIIGTGPACNQKMEENPNLITFSRDEVWVGNIWSRGPNRDLVRDLTPGPTPIRLTCTNAANRLWYPGKGKSITEAVKKIRDNGWTATSVNYSLPKPGAPTPSSGPPSSGNSKSMHNEWLDATDSEITELKAALKEYDVDFFDHMTVDNLIHPDKSVRDQGIMHASENLEAAERCGGGAVCAGLGSRGSGTGIHPDNWTAETWKICVESIKQILKNTAGCKSVLGMEAVVTSPMDGPEAHLKLIEDVGDPRCQVALDPANMFTMENYYHSTEMINRCFDMLGENIANCHAKDRTIQGYNLQFIVPGQGVQDYETYLVRMSRMKRPRVLMLEHIQDEEYPVAKAFIEKTAEKLGVKIYS